MKGKRGQMGRAVAIELGLIWEQLRTQGQARARVGSVLGDEMQAASGLDRLRAGERAGNQWAAPCRHLYPLEEDKQGTLAKCLTTPQKNEYQLF